MWAFHELKIENNFFPKFNLRILLRLSYISFSLVLRTLFRAENSRKRIFYIISSTIDYSMSIPNFYTLLCLIYTLKIVSS